VKLTLVFGRDDPARVRFAVSPLFETTAALRVVLESRRHQSHRQRHQYHLPWLESVRLDLERLETWPLEVLSPHSGWHPDFLTPIPAGPSADIADQLAQVAATPPEQVAHELRRSLTERNGEPLDEAAWGLLDDPVATRAVLADVLDRCWKLLVAPHWPRLSDLLQADVMYRTQTLGDYGLERMLGDLHERIRWTGRAMVIDWPGQSAVHELDGDGLVLIPTAFNWPSLSPFIDPPVRKALAYPARGIAELWQPTRTAHSAALARLLGTTRAALLESLAEPASTGTLARRHGLAASTVSEHLAALQGTELITRRRHRHSVMYQQTPLGAQLASAEPGPRQSRRTRS
jgi:DNA-binding transcriptional ArsR family regulator